MIKYIVINRLVSKLAWNRSPFLFCQYRMSGNETLLSFIPCFLEYMKIIAIFYYPVLYYPLLVCGTLQHKAGYVFGTLLSFSHFCVLLWQKFDCPKTPEVRHLQHVCVSCYGWVIMKKYYIMLYVIFNHNIE